MHAPSSSLGLGSQPTPCYMSLARPWCTQCRTLSPAPATSSLHLAHTYACTALHHIVDYIAYCVTLLPFSNALQSRVLTIVAALSRTPRPAENLGRTTTTPQAKPSSHTYVTRRARADQIDLAHINLPDYVRERQAEDGRRRVRLDVQCLMCGDHDFRQQGPDGTRRTIPVLVWCAMMDETAPLYGATLIQTSSATPTRRAFVAATTLCGFHYITTAMAMWGAEHLGVSKPAHIPLSGTQPSISGSSEPTGPYQ
jgi:hypothetical protein